LLGGWIGFYTGVWVLVRLLRRRGRAGGWAERAAAADRGRGEAIRES
jgi:hypothetical protein